MYGTRRHKVAQLGTLIPDYKAGMRLSYVEYHR